MRCDVSIHLWNIKELNVKMKSRNLKLTVRSTCRWASVVLRRVTGWRTNKVKDDVCDYYADSHNI